MFSDRRWSHVLARPLLMKPRPRSGARAMPWTPLVSAIVPFTSLESASSTSTWLPCETYTPPARVVHDQVIPAAVAGHGDRLEQVVAFAPRRRPRRRPRGPGRQATSLRTTTSGGKGRFWWASAILSVRRSGARIFRHGASGGGRGNEKAPKGAAFGGIASVRVLSGPRRSATAPVRGWAGAAPPFPAARP